MTAITPLVQIAGGRDGANWPAPGVELDVPADEAAQLVTAGLAKYVAPKVETAVVESAVETATVSAPGLSTDTGL